MRRLSKLVHTLLDHYFSVSHSIYFYVLFFSSEEEGDEVENDASDVLLKRDQEVEEDSDTNDIPESSTADEI